MPSDEKRNTGQYSLSFVVDTTHQLMGWSHYTPLQSALFNLLPSFYKWLITFYHALWESATNSVADIYFWVPKPNTYFNSFAV